MLCRLSPASRRSPPSLNNVALECSHWPGLDWVVTHCHLTVGVDEFWPGSYSARGSNSHVSAAGIALTRLARSRVAAHAAQPQGHWQQLAAPPSLLRLMKLKPSPTSFTVQACRSSPERTRKQASTRHRCFRFARSLNPVRCPPSSLRLFILYFLLSLQLPIGSIRQPLPATQTHPCCFTYALSLFPSYFGPPPLWASSSHRYYLSLAFFGSSYHLLPYHSLLFGHIARMSSSNRRRVATTAGKPHRPPRRSYMPQGLS
jgi:hypothetical protein